MIFLLSCNKIKLSWIIETFLNFFEYFLYLNSNSQNKAFIIEYLEKILILDDDSSLYEIILFKELKKKKNNCFKFVIGMKKRGCFLKLLHKKISDIKGVVSLKFFNEFRTNINL